jgi:hypothetical protein
MAARKWLSAAWLDKTVIAQPASPLATPTLAERARVATAKANADTAVIGTSQLNVSPEAVPDAREAHTPRAASTANTASARTNKTIRLLTAMLADNSHAGSTPGP